MTTSICRHIGAALLALAPLSLAHAQGPGTAMAVDFRTSTMLAGSTDSSSMSGHIVASGDKVRIELAKADPGSPTPVPMGGPGKMIVSDSGRTVTYLDEAKHEYIRFRPADMMAQASQMGGMKMEFSGTQATVDNLGAGPVILGHPTTHYRVGTGMTMTINAMGQEQSVKIASTTEYYFPTDVKTSINPFASMTWTDMFSMFGSRNREFTDKMKAAQDKLPKAPPLRMLATVTINTSGVNRVTKSNTEVTSLQWVTADPKSFEVPAGYKPVEIPGMMGSGSPPPGR